MNLATYMASVVSPYILPIMYAGGEVMRYIGICWILVFVGCYQSQPALRGSEHGKTVGKLSVTS